MKNNKLKEEVPTNAVAGGAVAGLGVGPQGEPGVNKKKKKTVITFKDFFKRKEV